MSRRRKIDYEAVFQSVLDLFQGAPRVEEVTLDFEGAAWEAIRSCLPGIRLSGCVFHWTQAVWRKTQELGLQTPYMEDEATHTLIRRLLALPFLPATCIPEIFEKIQRKASTASLRDLFHYVAHFWIQSTLFPPESWSVFKSSVRTNNDVEGWHRRLNHRAQKSQLPLYLLIQLLHEEGRSVDVTAQLVKEQELRRYQKRAYANINGKLERRWEEFEMTRKPFQLLKACANCYEPNIL